MKANRKFLNQEEAVSPVIAVILMVAITVVLAATVFVLVSDIGSKSTKNAPQIGWSDDEANDKMLVTQAPPSVFWRDFTVKGLGASQTGPGVKLNSGTYRFESGTGTGTNTVVDSTTTTSVTGGDSLNFCGPSGGGSITLVHTPSNAVAHQFTFQSFAVTGTSCA